jgi:hypothetical protein
MMTVSDIAAATKFYKKASGFAKRGILTANPSMPS